MKEEREVLKTTLELYLSMQNSCFTGEKQGSKDMFLKKEMLWNDKAEVKKWF